MPPTSQGDTLRLFILFNNLISLYLCCLSNPRVKCSVASGSYNSPECLQAAHGAPTYIGDRVSIGRSNMYANGQYHGFLGENVQARAYSSSGDVADFARHDSDLQCQAAEGCRWRNDPDDELDWVTGQGAVDPMKLALITGSNTLPGESFLILASDPRPPFHGGSLISPKIGCQQSSGVLSFRLWRSRARTSGLEPNVDICTRKIPDSTLENCLTVELTDNHTIVASIPSIIEPFEIVLRGYGFSNEPEGGLLLIDNIDYFAHIDSTENCIRNNIDKESGLVPFLTTTVPSDNEQEVEVGSTDSWFSEEDSDMTRSIENRAETNVGSEDMVTDVVSNLTTPPDRPTAADLIMIEDHSDDSCRSLQCTFDEEDAPCDYLRIGENSHGAGFSTGWKVLQADSNIANRLTGIHESPSDQNGSFLVAEFPGFERQRRDHRFVLESPEFILSDSTDAYLSFRKYVATLGIEMTVCEDSLQRLCFWDNFRHSAEPFARSWTSEIVKLPTNLNKDPHSKANAGQVGLAQIGLFADPEATIPLC